MVPMRALATVKPSSNGDKSKVLFNQSVVPEITAVSNPKSSPPSAAMAVDKIKVLFKGMFFNWFLNIESFSMISILRV
jgi:hypothetical protein